ncbi:hypothetical protein CMV_011326 [Castanea mollissima]|uniref:Uncharacterized protein n=1 Tax=Castanea mollissima TaxID=60419 RepID=A0A8J4RB40_9ROSI|nr:hypothetical protein CMV_011326 [Castanea mollissima]
MSCCCHHLLESGLCCQHHGFSSIVTNLASWCGMLLLVISCTLLKGIKHQFTPCALIIRKTFTYAAKAIHIHGQWLPLDNYCCRGLITGCSLHSI